MIKLSEVLEWILQIKMLHSFNVVNMKLIAEYFYLDSFYFLLLCLSPENALLCLFYFQLSN